MIPIFLRLFDKFGYSILFLIILFPRLIWPGGTFYETSAFTFIRYFPTIVLGICAHRGEWFEKIAEGEKCQKICLVTSVVVSVCFVYVRFNYGYMYIVDSVLALLICFISYLFISNIKILRVLLELIGKHSMNMFLLHSFVMAYFLNEFTYSFKWPELIILVLILDTLSISWCIEKEKQIIVKIVDKLKVKTLLERIYENIRYDNSRW